MRRIVAGQKRVDEDSMGSTLVLALAIFLAPAICHAGILDPWQWARSDRIEVNIPWLLFENETRCYEDLGCLNITRSWYHLLHRPFNVFPLPREVINTRFILYTKANPTEGQVLIASKDKSIKRSNFDPKRETKFIIHGFIDTPLSNWVKEMRNELLKHSDYNVIIVDWAGGSLPLYTQATANTRLVGLEIAHLVTHLQTNYGLDLENVHLIGHSLGAHTAGYAGEKLAGQISRITGLDPAEPYFQGMPNHLRLDPSDAKLVDVIHTDGKNIFFLGIPGYGMSQPCGHLDFYPNNGKEQPGCTDLSETTPSLPLTLIREGLEEASRVLVACNHVRAIKLFTESINSKCQYVAHECGSFSSFMRGECFSCKSNSSLSCAVMGYHADKSPALLKHQSQDQDDTTPLLGSRFFFTTGKEEPYCRKHYRITIDLARPSTAESWVQGFMKATLHADNGVIRNLDLTPSGYMKLEHGTTARMVVSHTGGASGDIGKIRRVELSWEYDMDVLQPRSLCFFWCNDRLYVNSVAVDIMELPGRGKREADFSSKLCSAGRQEFAEIASRSSASFVDNCS
ncbi:pancreatic triacylglycerol lipase-like isoform X2 [Neodiprion virginianus]|uniref:phospholipase A1 n=1 Tax=Neodiprion lecontei TaxID=441921 RepID=A0A6J0BKV0_NEOLC|nr:pancreatic triacylglycerol lipase isoform X2 [Neodiprion lecontei]XP_046421524.1 pancreatic triacylglycerol lipase-like isoform X2 [Neodiprion fabricii]XP_046615700.1 pancreatic triacylglycerol lipase-like isoform X2 [Neodiprion virginianus]